MVNAVDQSPLVSLAKPLANSSRAAVSSAGLGVGAAHALDADVELAKAKQTRHREIDRSPPARRFGASMRVATEWPRFAARET
jgi:hypothetical protein